MAQAHRTARASSIFPLPMMPGVRAAASPAWAGLCALMIAAVAAADYATGYEVSLSTLYLAPVFVATWAYGLTGGVLASVLAAMTWYLMFANAHLFPHHFYYGWEAFLRIFTGVVFAILIDRLKLALARSDHRFMTVLEGLNAAVFVAYYNDDRLLYLNEHGRAAFGPDARSLGDILRRFGDADDKAPIDREPLQYEAQDCVTAKWYLIEVQPLRWVDGRDAALHVATDVTARKRVEQLAEDHRQKLEMSSRLITAGEMASTLAHELNQPLAAVLNYNTGCIELLQSETATREELLEGLEKSTEQAARAGTIVQQVREFIRRREPHFAHCDLREVMSEAERLLHAEAGKSRVCLDFEVPAEAAVAEVDRVMLQQLVLNLAKNALEAMRDVGDDRKRLLIRLRMDAQVRMEVADQGCGLPVEMTERLFIPFYSTKPNGMGLGLQICRSVAEYHDGRLWATPNVPHGTVFHFTFPAARP